MKPDLRALKDYLSRFLTDHAPSTALTEEQRTRMLPLQLSMIRIECEKLQTEMAALKYLQ